MNVIILLKEIVYTLQKIDKHCLKSKKECYKNEDYFDFEIRMGIDSCEIRSKLYQQLFVEFYFLGIQASKYNIKSFYHLNNDSINEQVENLIHMIVQVKCWLQNFSNLYKVLHMRCDSFENIYDLNLIFIIRSGIQFMLDLLSGFNNESDELFFFIKNEINNSFDNFICSIMENGAYTYVNNSEQVYIPKNHVWWQ